MPDVLKLKVKAGKTLRWDLPGNIVTSGIPSMGNIKTVSSAFQYVADKAADGIERLHFYKEDGSQVVVQIECVPLVDPFDWVQKVPGLHDLDPSKIIEWDITAGPVPEHDRASLILATGRDEPFTGKVDFARNIRGGIIMSGVDFQPKPTAKFGGFDGIDVIMRWVLAPDAVNPFIWEGRDWPLMIVANCRVNFHINKVVCGDIMRPNVKFPQRNITDGSFRGGKGAIMVYRFLNECGAQYISADGHSDHVQTLGGFPIVRWEDCHIRQPGGMFCFVGREAEVCGFPRQTQWQLSNVVWEHIPLWDDSVPKHPFNSNPRFVNGWEDQPKFETSDPANGRYLSVKFDRPCYIRGPFKLEDKANVGLYLTPRDGVSIDSNGDYHFSAQKTGSHQFPLYSGSLNYQQSGGPLPVSTLDHGTTGIGQGLKGKDHLMSLLGK